VATQVNTIPVLTGTQFGVDFNPVPDALRIVSDADQNLRITMGGAGIVNTDGTLKPPKGSSGRLALSPAVVLSRTNLRLQSGNSLPLVLRRHGTKCDG
jgi:hypothetical protein